MEYELQGNGSDGRAVFISEKGDSTSWHSLILNVRHKLETRDTKHPQHTALHPKREFKPARSKQTMNHKDRIPNSKQINLVVSKLVLVWHGCLFWCMSSCWFATWNATKNFCVYWMNMHKTRTLKEYRN